MIKMPTLFDAQSFKDIKPIPQNLPSRQQLQRLSTGDTVQLNSYGESFLCRIVFRSGNYSVGRITGHLERTADHHLQKDDLIIFGSFAIFQVLPGEHVQLPADWMLCTWPGVSENLQCLLRTKWPSLLASAELKADGFVSMKLIRLYDEPEDPATEIPKLLDGGRRWFIENYIVKK